MQVTFSPFASHDKTLSQKSQSIVRLCEILAISFLLCSLDVALLEMKQLKIHSSAKLGNHGSSKEQELTTEY